MPVTVLSDLNQMTTEDIVLAASSIHTQLEMDLDFPQEYKELGRLLDELERRLVLDKYVAD